jgi:MFS family permease
MSSIHAQAGRGPRPLLRTRLGMLTLLLLCGVQFLDVVDSSITNVAFPSIQHALHFSQQNLQWVASGYLLTYGGFLLLGGRLADLLGRRRVLVAGLVGFAACSLAAGVAQSEGTLIAARVLQGVGAATMAPAALSILTTTFREGADRNTALGVWGAISGLAAAAGVFLGGLLSEGPGWRWVFFVNIPVCLLAVGASFALLTGERKRAPVADFDTPGALLGTGGMLLLVYALIEAPDVGWGKPRTIATLSGAAVMLVAFVVNEHRRRNPLMHLSIFRVRGLAAADGTWLLGMAVFVGVTTAANAGVPADKAGLAAGLLSTSQQLGMALGLAVLSAIATARTHHLLAAHAPRAEALTYGYQRALLVCSIFVLAAALIATRIPTTRAAAQPLVARAADPAAEPAAV